MLKLVGFGFDMNIMPLTILFQQHYSRKNKDTTGVPRPSSDTPLDDITIPSDDSSRIDSKVQNSPPLTFESTALNRQVDQSR